jgi:predicted phosphodiesterase
MPSYARVGQWPVLHVPPVQAGETSGIAVINIFPELIDVLVKPMGESFGPRLFLDKTGKSPALGVPPFIQGQPLVKVAHISDTQIQLPTTTQTPDGKPLDQENMKAAIEEINGLGVDLVVNTGDLVNVGSNEEQWKVYQELRKPLRVPIHEVLGNHDWNQTTPEGSVLTGNFLKYTEDPLIYDVESKGVFFVLFGTAVVRREDLLQRVEKAKNARVTVLAYHDPMTEVKGYNWWKPETYQAVQALKPSVAFAGHLHFNQWNRKEGIHEFVGPSLAWTKMGDPGWNGYFIHAFYEKAVVSSFKRLGCNDLFFTVVTPYRADRAGSGTPPR